MMYTINKKNENWILPTSNSFCLIASHLVVQPGIPGGHSTFFLGRGVRPGFLKWGGLVNWSLPLKDGACELKISKFGGLWIENFQIWALESKNLGEKWGKFPIFFPKGGLVNWLLLEMGPLWTTGEAWKGGLQGRTSHTPFLGQCPPPPRGLVYSLSSALGNNLDILDIAFVKRSWLHCVGPSELLYKRTTKNVLYHFFYWTVWHFRLCSW